MSPAKAKTTPAANTKKPAVPDTQVSQQQQSDMRKFMIIAISITTVIVLATGYISYTLIQANLQKAREITAQDAYKKMAGERLDKMNQAQDSLKQIQTADGGTISSFDLVTKRALPSSPDFATNITIFSELQKQTGVDMTSIGNGLSDSAKAAAASTSTSTTSAETLADGVSSYPVTLKISAKYSQVLDFISKVEQSVRVFNFSSMKISGDSDALALDMQYKAYYMAEPKIDTQVIPLEDYLENAKANPEKYNQ